jgi:hypothetical protein
VHLLPSQDDNVENICEASQTANLSKKSDFVKTLRKSSLKSSTHHNRYVAMHTIVTGKNVLKFSGTKILAFQWRRGWRCSVF